jgi:hypothetical protein
MSKELPIPFAPNILPRICVVCGATLPNQRRRYCSDTCRRSARYTPRAHQEAPASPTAPPTPAERQKPGDKPAATPDQQVHYRATLLPALARVPIAALMRATGLSRSYVKRIRAGSAIPHPVHWPALAEVAGLER